MITLYHFHNEIHDEVRKNDKVHNSLIKNYNLKSGNYIFCWIINFGFTQLQSITRPEKQWSNLKVKNPSNDSLQMKMAIRSFKPSKCHY